MKKITLLAIFLSSSIGLFSQTSLDFLLFEKINEYRNAHGLKSWEWDQNVWEASNSHNKYLMDLGRLTHYQEGSDSTYTGGDRLIQQGVTWYLTRENCAMRYRYDNETDEEQSEKILLQWINSPGHNETLLCSKSKYGAVSTTHGTKLKSYTDARRTYATLNVYI
tara:strand:+ start:2482 stop:2976 length:495 start_codon:yes stop_codon:yes gene_type:complete